MEIVELLLDARAMLTPIRRKSEASIAWRSRAAWPLLQVAIELHMYEPMVDLLLTKGCADVTDRYDGLAAVHAAIDAMRASRRHDTSVLRRILAHPGVNVNLQDEFPLGSPLTFAVSRCLPAAVETLLKDGGADPNALRNVVKESRDFRDGPTTYPAVAPLHIAVIFGCFSAVEPLLKASADPNAMCGKGYTPLHHAASHKRSAQDNSIMLGIVEALCKGGANLALRRDHADPAERHTPLGLALRDGNIEVARTLVKMGARAADTAPTAAELVVLAMGRPHGQPGDLHYDPSHICGRIKLLVDAGAGADLAMAGNPHSRRLLLLDLAEWRCDEDVVALAGAGADASVMDERGRTPLRLMLWRMNEARRYEYRQRPVSAATVAALVLAGDFESWDVIPDNLEGLECFLARFYKEAPDQMGNLFKKLPEETQARVREALRVMHRLLPGGEGPSQIRFDIVTQAFK
jgi:hypothetical protein